MKTECRFMAQFENNKSRKVAADIIKECSVFPAAKNENVNREDKVNCYYDMVTAEALAEKENTKA